MTNTTDKNTNYFIRITAEPQLIISWLKSNQHFTNMLAYIHKDDVQRPHVHIIAFKSLVCYQAIKISWKNTWFSITDKPWARSDWTFKPFEDTEEDVKRMIVYCSKGKYTPAHMTPPIPDGGQYNIYSTYALHQALKDWEPPKRNVPIQYKLVEALNPTQMKKKKNVMIHEIVEKLDETPSDQEIVDTIVEYFKIEKIIFNRYLVKEFFDTIIARIKTRSFKQEMYVFCKINNYREYE